MHQHDDVAGEFVAPTTTTTTTTRVHDAVRVGDIPYAQAGDTLAEAFRRLGREIRDAEESGSDEDLDALGHAYAWAERAGSAERACVRALYAEALAAGRRREAKEYDRVLLLLCGAEGEDALLRILDLYMP